MSMNERQLEEGLAKADSNAEKNAHVAVDEGQSAPVKERRRHHYRERLHLKRKQKVDAKLPGIMQGGTLEQSKRRLTIKNEVVAAVGEFCGTFLFLFFSFGIATIAGQQNLTANSAQQVQDTGGASTSTSLDASQLLYSSLGFGFSLAVNAWLFFRISGGLFNPAVTLALLLTKNITFLRACILFPVQFAGGIAAAGMSAVLIPGGLNARSRLSGSTTIAQGFFIEAFMTAQLVLAVFLLAGEKHKGTFLAPVGIGLSLFIAEMWATGFTGGSLNPARTLGPDVIARSFESTTWIYYTAPLVGSLMATALYSFLKYVQYHTAVEGQDDDAVALVMRDQRGAVVGYVDQVRQEEAPEVVKAAGSVPPSPHGSVMNLPDTAGPNTPVAEGFPLSALNEPHNDAATTVVSSSNSRDHTDAPVVEQRGIAA